MPKRKLSDTKESSKKEKLDLQPAPCDITKQDAHTQKETETPWPDSDIHALLAKIEENIPENDSVSYSTRLDQLNWDEISFKSHNSKECKEMWAALSRQVRKFRLLGEIINDVKQCVSKPKSKSSPPFKHPEKPKQPRNSYMFFVEAKRQKVMKNNPELHPMDVSRKLGQMFKDLSEKERAKYDAAAEVARQEYREKLKVFYEEHPEMIPKKTNRKGKVAPQFEPDGAPVKPKTPFEIFLRVESEKESDDCSTQKCREKWNGLTDKEKYFWIKWSEEQYQKYMEDLKDYIKAHPDYTPKKIKPILTKKERKIKDCCTGKPSKPPQSPYHLFCKMMFNSEDARTMNRNELMNYIGEKWRACTDEEKNEYKIRVDQMWDEYRAKLEEYLKTLPPEERNIARDKERPKKNNKTENKAVAVEKEQEKPKTKVEQPKRPPKTKYKYFLSVYEGEKDPSEIWKAMTNSEKQFFEVKLAEQKCKYITAYENFLNSLSREDLEQLAVSLADDDTSSAESESDED